MAQTNYTPISLYYSTTASAVPTAANLVQGELAINTADGKLYYEDSSGVVQVLATKSTGSIGGSNTQVQFNNSGSLGGSSGLTWDGSFLTTSSIKNSALTSGRVTYAGASGLLSDSANFTYNGTLLSVSATGSSATTLAQFRQLISGVNTGDARITVGNEVYNPLVIGQNAGSSGFTYGTTNDAFFVNTANSGMLFGTNGTERMRITSAGSIGIGTSSPSYTLDLSSTTNGIIARFKSTSTYGQVVADNSSGTGGGLFVTKQNGTNTAIFGNSGGILGNTSTDVGIYGAVAGSSINFYNDDTPILKMTLNSSGNLGLGVTPSASSGSYRNLQNGGALLMGASGTADIYLNANAFYDGAWKYISTGVAARYSMNGSVNGHSWDVAVSGSAGTAVTWLEKMRLDSSGNLLVGTTSTITGTKFGATSTTTSGAGEFYVNSAGADAINAINIIKYSTTNTTAQQFIGFTINNANTGSGQINANGASQAAFGSFSDARLKENIVDLPSQLNNILALKPKEFDYIQSEGGGHQIGFVAQDMQTVYPDAISERADGMLVVTGWSKTEARLVKAIQEQQALIESLTTRLNALENK